MIQINLIPDVKLEFIHAQQMRRVAISISLVVGAGAVGGQGQAEAKAKKEQKCQQEGGGSV